MRNKELDAYVTKLERKLGSEKVKKGAFAAVSSMPVRRVEKESLLDALAELQEENARLHAALQVRDDNAAITLPFTEFWKCPLERVFTNTQPCCSPAGGRGGP